jgi:hypothetical protein
MSWPKQVPRKFVYWNCKIVFMVEKYPDLKIGRCRGIPTTQFELTLPIILSNVIGTFILIETVVVFVGGDVECLLGLGDKLSSVPIKSGRVRREYVMDGDFLPQSLALVKRLRLVCFAVRMLKCIGYS